MSGVGSIGLEILESRSQFDERKLAVTKKILVLGGAHIDRRGRILAETAHGASNPGTWFEEPGGGGFNAARNLSRLGFTVRLISPRGGDAAEGCVIESDLDGDRQANAHQGWIRGPRGAGGLAGSTGDVGAR